MLVDDNQLLAHMLTALLHRFIPTVAVRTYTSSREASNQLGATRLAVLVTDIEMPEIDGLQLLRHAREHVPETTIVVMSGRLDASILLTALQAGAFDVLTKPLNCESFPSTVQEALRVHRLARLAKATRWQLTRSSTPRTTSRDSSHRSEMLQLKLLQRESELKRAYAEAAQRAYQRLSR